MWATILISILLAAVVVLIVRGLVRDRKNAKTRGGCPRGCSGCSGGCAYHSQSQIKKQNQ